MKNTTWRLIAFFVLIAAVIILWKSCFKKEKQLEVKDEKITTLDSSVKTWRDKAGYEHAKKQVVYSNNISLQQENDSLKKLLNIKEEQLLEATSITTTNKGRIETETVPVLVSNGQGYISDTGRSFSFNDRWLKLNGISLRDKTTIDYSMDDSLTIATFTERKWLLGKKRTYVDVFSANPRVTVNGLRSVRKEVKQPGRLGIGPFIGATWNGEWRPVYGIGLSYQIIRF